MVICAALPTDNLLPARAETAHMSVRTVPAQNVASNPLRQPFLSGAVTKLSDDVERWWLRVHCKAGGFRQGLRERVEPGVSSLGAVADSILT